MDRLTSEKDDLNLAKVGLEESSKRLQKQMRELREEFGESQKREMESTHRKKELVSDKLLYDIRCTQVFVNWSVL